MQTMTQEEYKKAHARFLKRVRRQNARLVADAYQRGVNEGRALEARIHATADNLQKQRREEHARMREAFIRGLDASTQAITSHAHILDAFMRLQERQ